MNVRTEVDWQHELMEQLDFHWQRQLRPGLDGLTDEEFFWEPVDGMWSIKPRGEEIVVDFEFPAPEPPPLTTIAWRMGHVTVGVFGMRASSHFGDGSLTYETATWPRTAAEALDALDAQYEAWTSGVRALGPDGLAQPCGSAEGPYAEYPFATLVLHISREAIHHGAEMLLLRDLYRTSAAGHSWRP